MMGLASLGHQALEWNFEESRYSKIKPGLPYCHEGIIIQIRGVTYVL